MNDQSHLSRRQQAFQDGTNKENMESWLGSTNYLYSTDFVNGQHRVPVKIESPTASNNDLYMMYNRKEGVNSEVIRHGDEGTKLVKGFS